LLIVSDLIVPKAYVHIMTALSPRHCCQSWRLFKVRHPSSTRNALSLSPHLLLRLFALFHSARTSDLIIHVGTRAPGPVASASNTATPAAMKWRGVRRFRSRNASRTSGNQAARCDRRASTSGRRALKWGAIHTPPQPPQQGSVPAKGCPCLAFQRWSRSEKSIHLPASLGC